MPVRTISQRSVATTIEIAEFCDLPGAPSPTCRQGSLRLPRIKDAGTMLGTSGVCFEMRVKRTKALDSGSNQLPSRDRPEPHDPLDLPLAVVEAGTVHHLVAYPDLPEPPATSPLISAVECARLYERDLAAVRALVARADRYAKQSDSSPMEDLLTSSVMRGAGRRIYFHRDRLHEWIKQMAWCRKGKSSSMRQVSQDATASAKPA